MISAVSCVPPVVSAAPAGAAAVPLPAQRFCSIMSWMSAECAARIVLGALQGVQVVGAAHPAEGKISLHVSGKQEYGWIHQTKLKFCSFTDLSPACCPPVKSKYSMCSLCSSITFSQMVTCNCDCMDPECGRLECCCLHIRCNFATIIFF